MVAYKWIIANNAFLLFRSLALFGCYIAIVSVAVLVGQQEEVGIISE